MGDENNRKTQSLLSGAMLLMVITVVVHVINIFFKIPITNIIGEVGRGYFTSAYELYTPIYAISMAGLPVAVSKMISERMATGRYREVRRVRDASKRLFLITGIVGTLLMLVLAYPFSHNIIGSPNSFLSILCIGPSIFFCCMMSTYRGYYEGLRNMAPTGFSQLFECLGKLVFGIGLAKYVLKIANDQFEATGVVFGVKCETAKDVVLAAAPYSSAAAIAGVTIGTILALIYCFIIYHKNGDGITEEELLGSPEPEEIGSLTKTLFTTVVPIATSALVLNITNLIDTSTIQSRLKHATAIGEDVIRNIYPEITELGIKSVDIKDFLYGCYGVALDFRNLIPTVIMTLGVSAIPVLSAAFTRHETDKMQDAIHTVVKTASLLAVPAGFVMAALAEPMLRILFPSSHSISISAPFVAVFGYAALLLAISTPINNMLQAVGRADVPVKSLLFGATAKIIINLILVGNPAINIKGAPVGTIVCYLIIVINNLLVLIKVCGVHINWLDALIKPFIVGALSGFAALGTNYVIIEKIFNLQGNLTSMKSLVSCAISLIVAVIVWVILLAIFKVLTKNDVLSLPKGQKIAKVLEKLKVLG